MELFITIIVTFFAGMGAGRDINSTVPRASEFCMRVRVCWFHRSLRAALRSAASVRVLRISQVS